MSINHPALGVASYGLVLNQQKITPLEACSPERNHGFYRGNHPQMAELFRLVNYYNLPSIIPQFHLTMPGMHQKRKTVSHILSPYLRLLNEAVVEPDMVNHVQNMQDG